MGMAFPLFTDRMFVALGYQWANTLFAILAVLMIPVPYVRRLSFVHTFILLIVFTVTDLVLLWSTDSNAQ